MIVRDFKRLALFVVPLLIITFVWLNSDSWPRRVHERLKTWDSHGKGSVKDSTKDSVKESTKDNSGLENDKELQTATNPWSNHEATHQEICSLSTNDHKYLNIDFRPLNGANPNILPHPTLEHTWVIVAQLVQPQGSQGFSEIVCNAILEKGRLRCLEDPKILPIADTTGSRCEGQIEFFNTARGPHDARLTYGPETAYVVYGSNSDFTCFGQFIQNINSLIDGWGDKDNSTFAEGTELQRPTPWFEVEKNWYPFWDSGNQMHLHFDVYPNRVFAAVNPDGSVGPNLAPLSQATDEKCFAKYMPKLAPEHESIHQATNSLQITMCERSNKSCEVNDSNTFILSLYQRKTFYGFHSVYEPYVMLTQRHAPFAVHAISKQPLWIHGRQVRMDRNTSDMLYVTSISWKNKGQKYHGYLDDELFLSFGVEDATGGAADLIAKHLLEGIGLCNEE